MKFTPKPYNFSTRRYISLAVFFAGCGLSAPAMAGQDYTVEGVTVDITAANAVDARTQAFTKAQEDGFRKVAQQLIGEASAQALQLPPDDQLPAYVDDYEITQEKLSSVRYIGTYTFRFKADDVRRYVDDHPVTVVATPPSQTLNQTSTTTSTTTTHTSGAILVVPYYQTAGHAMLWSETNPWLIAWRHAPAGTPAVIAPLGDTQDFANMHDDAAKTYDPEQLAAMTARYGAGSADILVATGGEAQGLDIQILAATHAGPRPLSTVHVGNGDKKPDESVFDAAVRITRPMLAAAPSTVSVTTTTSSDATDNTSTGPTASLTTKVHIASMQEWVTMQRSLRRVPGVDDIKTISLKPGEATVTIVYEGPESALRAALQSTGMDLTGGTGGGYDAAYGSPGWGTGGTYELRPSTGTPTSATPVSATPAPAPAPSYPY